MCSDSFPSCPAMDPVSQEVSDLSENLHQGDGRFTQGHNRDLCEASPAQRNWYTMEQVSGQPEKTALMV